MEIILFLLSVLFLFGLIYFAVKLAIAPLLLDKLEKDMIYKRELELFKLRNMEILSDTELEEVIIELCRKRGAERGTYEQYRKYSEVLKEIKETGYFTDEEYLYRKVKLKEHLKIE